MSGSAVGRVVRLTVDKRVIPGIKLGAMEMGPRFVDRGHVVGCGARRRRPAREDVPEGNRACIRGRGQPVKHAALSKGALPDPQAREGDWRRLSTPWSTSRCTATDWIAWGDGTP